MNHYYSEQDLQFKQNFESAVTPLTEFTHRAHLRLAYIYLCDHSLDSAYQQTRLALLNFLRANSIDAAKYHETMTRAWLQAVRHFMMTAPVMLSAADFIQHNSQLLDFKIMLTHYSESRLFNNEARLAYVAPDLDPFPHYAD